VGLVRGSQRTRPASHTTAPMVDVDVVGEEHL